ncbi:unnamed protein product [Protopolystoma xenopodis]|uniref:Uncharacterized protein n=1 Tax=Protopolystoma xenopodis TaxID=117903 RepID=A0A3S4ZRT2_9PLAT|nr:unnamed protein product [Protopolystoma xenopodis]
MCGLKKLSHAERLVSAIWLDRGGFIHLRGPNAWTLTHHAPPEPLSETPVHVITSQRRGTECRGQNQYGWELSCITFCGCAGRFRIGVRPFARLCVRGRSLADPMAV